MIPELRDDSEMEPRSGSAQELQDYLGTIAEEVHEFLNATQGKFRLLRIRTSRRHAVGNGSAPASGAVNRALAVHTDAKISPPFDAFRSRRCSARGAPNCSRGGCAPRKIQMHRSGFREPGRLTQLDLVFINPELAATADAHSLMIQQLFWAAERQSRAHRTNPSHAPALER